jgi:hypothetical protein
MENLAASKAYISRFDSSRISSDKFPGDLVSVRSKFGEP